MRQEALESNQDFLRILDEALVSVSTREALESVSTSTSDEHVQDARLDEETIQDTASAKTQTTPDTSTAYLISKKPGNQGLDELYAIENYTMHAFRVISIILNNSSENSLEQAFMYTKSRLNYWLANPKFMKLRIGLYMHEDDVPERQILENGLFYLDACTRLLHLTRNKDDSPILRKWLKDADMDEAYNVFLASHSELEQLLTVSWENTIKPVLAGTIDMNNKQESRSKTVAMEGTLAIRKRRYQKIIDDYRRRKQEREQIIKDGDKTTSTQTSRTSHKSSRSANDAPESKEEKDASPDVQDDEVKTAVDQQIKAPIKSKTEITVRNEPEEQLTKPNDEGKFLSERILKIAIGVGRLLHSIAMSTGRNTLSENDTTIDAPWSASAVDLEQRLYEKAYATFKMTASFQEQNAHAQFPSVSSSQNAIVDANMAEHHLHSSDMFVQNQLDIADTLSCLGFVLDTKRKKYEAALSSYKRAVEIYTFFMGDKSEAAEKAWHNIGILHVALSSRKDGDSKGHIEEPQASPHEESSADPKHSHLDDSLDSWRHVLACQHYNHSQEGQKNVTLDHALPVAFTLEYIAKVYELKKNEQEALAAFGNSLLQVQRVLNAEDKQNLNVSEALSTRDRLLHKIFQIMYKRREFEKICQLIVDHFVDTTSFIDYFSKSTNDFKLVLVGGLSLFRVGKLEDAALSLASYLTSKEYIRVCSGTEETKKELADCSMLIDLSTLLSDQVSVVANVDRLKKATDRTIEACFVVATLMQTKMVENAVQCKEPPGESKKCDELIAILEALHTLMKAWKRKQESLHGEIHDVFSQYLADLHFYKGEIFDVILHEMDAAFVEYTRALDLYEMRRSKIEAQMQHQSDYVADQDEVLISKEINCNTKLRAILEQVHKTWFRLGQLSRRMGDPEHALQCFGSALRIQKACATEQCPSQEETEESLMVGDKLTPEIAKTILSLGYIYADSNLKQFSPILAMSSLKEGTRIYSELVSSHDVDSLSKKSYYLELEKAYKIMLNIDSRSFFEDTTEEGSKSKEEAEFIASEETCDIFFRLGNVCGLQQKYEQASEYYFQGLAYLKGTGRENDLIYGSILHNQGIVLAKVGDKERIVEAREVFERALAITEQHLGSYHPAVGDTLHELGATIFSQGVVEDFHIALSHLERALKIREKTMGPKHVVVSHSLFSLAQIHSSLKQPDRALHCLGRALQIRKEAHGPQSGQVADVLNLLGMVHLQRSTPKDNSVALSCLQEAARIRSIILGREHGKTCSTLYNLAMLQASSGEESEALKLFDEILVYYRGVAEHANNKKGREKMEIGVSINIAKVLCAKGSIHENASQHEEARSCFQDALDIFLRLKPKHEPAPVAMTIADDDVVSTLHHLAIVFDRLEDHKDAIQCYTRVLVPYRKALGPDSIIVGRLLHRIGELQLILHKQSASALESFGDNALKAIQCLNEALRIYTYDTTQNPDMIGVIHLSLGRLYSSVKSASTDDRAEAIQHFLAALTAFERLRSHPNLPNPDMVSVPKTHNLQLGRNQEVFSSLSAPKVIRECLNQVITMIEMTPDQKIVSTEEKATLLFKLGNIVAQERDFSEAIGYYNAALEIQKELPSFEKELNIANTLHNLGNAYYKLSEYHQALKAYQDSLHMAKERLGSDQEVVAETLNCIGNVQRMLLNFDAAMDAYRETIRIRKKVLTENSYSLVFPLLHMASIQCNNKEYENALESYKEVLRLSKALGSGETLQIASALHGIATIHTVYLIDLNRASSCLREAIRIRKQVLEPNNILIPESLRDLGAIFSCMGKTSEAKGLYTEALTLFCSICGEKSLQVAKTLNNLGLVLEDGGESEAAAKCFEKALQIYQNNDFTRDLTYGDICHNFGVLQSKLDNQDQAVKFFDEALSVYDRLTILPEERAAKSLHSKGIVLAKKMQMESAETCLRMALELMTKMVEGDNEEIAETRFSLAKVLLERGEQEEASKYFKGALRVKLKSKGKDDLQVASILFPLGLIHSRRNEFIEAKTCLKEVLRVQRLRIGDECNDVAETLFCLGMVCREKGEPLEAIPYLSDALKIKLILRGPNHIETGNVLFLKGRAHQECADYDSALECLNQALKIRQVYFGELSYQYAQTIFALGCVFQSKKFLDQALTFHAQALDIFSAILRREEKDVLLCLRRIGSIKYESGSDLESVEVLEETLKLHRNSSNIDYEELSTVLYVRGLALTRQGRIQDGIDSFVEAISLRKHIDDVPGSAEIMLSLAEAYLKTDYGSRNAETLLRECVPMLESMESQSISLVTIKIQIQETLLKAYDIMLQLLQAEQYSSERSRLWTKKGNLQMLLQHFIDASKSYEESYKIQINSFEDNKLSVASALHNLGCAKLKLGESDAAITYLEEAISLTRSSGQVDDDDLAESLFQLGIANRNKANFKSALLHFRESAKIRYLLPGGKESLSLARTLLDQGGVHESIGEYDKAFALYRESLKVRRQALGPDSTQVASVIFCIGNIHRRRGEYEKALSCWNEALRIRNAAPMKNSLSIASSLYNLGVVHESLGDKDRADKLFCEALQIYRDIIGRDLVHEPRKRSAGPSTNEIDLEESQLSEFSESLKRYCDKINDRPAVAETLFNVGSLFDKLSDYSEALKFYRSAIAINASDFGRDHISLGNFHYAVGIAYHIQGRCSDALNYINESLRIKRIHLGSNHEQIEELLNIVGSLHQKLGNRDCALESFEEAIKAKESRLGKGGLDELEAITKLAEDAHQKGDLNASLKFYEEALKRRRKRDGDEDAMVGQTLYSIGMILNAMGMNELALSRLALALRIQRNGLGGDTVEVANTEFTIGVVCCDLRLYEDSLIHYVESMRIRRAHYGSENVQVAQCMHNIGVLQYETNNYRGAINQFEKALKIFKETLGPDHAEVGYTYNGLANAHREMRNTKKAAFCFEEALRIERQKLGSEHIDVGNTLHNFGVFLLEDCEKFIEAVKAFQQSVIIRRDHLGPDSLEVAATLRFMSDSYTRLGKRTEGLKLLKESVRIQERHVFSEADSAVFMAKTERENTIVQELLGCYAKALELNNTDSSLAMEKRELDDAGWTFKKGSLHGKLGQYVEAIHCFDQALEMQTKLLGPDHLTVANTMHNLGSVEMEVNDLERAEHHLVDAMAITKRIVGGEHLELADTMHTLASVYRKRQEYDKAVKLYDEASQIKRFHLGGEHLSLANTLYAMGSAYEAQGNYNKAMRCFMECLRIRRIRLGADSSAVAAILFCIGGVHEKRSETERAKQVYRECLRIRRLAPSPDRMDLANVLHNLGTALDSKEEFEEALMHYEEALDIYERSLGPNHLMVATVLANIGGLLFQIEDYIDSFQCYQRALFIRVHELGESHRDVAEMRLRIGIVEDKLSHNESAMDNYKQALRIFKDLDGYESETAAKILHGMALLWQKEEGQLEKALKCAAESVRIRKSHKDAAPEDIADTLYVMASIYESSNDAEMALKCFLECEDIYRRRLGSDHIFVGNVMFHSAVIFETMKRAEKAMEYYKVSLAIKRRELGSEHLEVAAILYRLGALHHRRSEHELASRLLEEALRIQRPVLGSVSEDVGQTLLVLGAALDSLSKWESALEIYLEALVIYRAANSGGLILANVLCRIGGVYDELGDHINAIAHFKEALSLYAVDVPALDEMSLSKTESDAGLRQKYLEVADANFNLGTSNEKCDRFEHAAIAYKSALELYVKLMGADCVDAAKTLHVMGMLYAKMSDYKVSTRLLQEALRVRKVHFGKRNLEVASTLYGLGLVYEKQQEFQNAQEHYLQALAIQRSLLGEKVIPVAETLNNLGVVCGNMGNYELALEHWDAALKIYKEARIPKDNPVVASIFDCIVSARKLAEGEKQNRT